MKSFAEILDDRSRRAFELLAELTSDPLTREERYAFTMGSLVVADAVDRFLSQSANAADKMRQLQSEAHEFMQAVRKTLMEQHGEL